MTDESGTAKNSELSGDVEWLRQEIIESEKTQADFLKWKFILIAAVGSVSLGFTSENHYGEGAQILLCVVPLLCAYVDLITLHIMGRIITVGKYLMCMGDKYENFVFAVRSRSGTSPYAFEAIALHGSSFILNGVLLGLGFLLPERVAASAVKAATSAATPPFGWNPSVLEAYKITGLAGVVVTALLVVAYEFRRDRVDRLADEFFNMRHPKR